MTNDMLSMRAFVVLAIKVLGPGRTRLELVKLAHDMSHARGQALPLHGRLHIAAESHQQAAPASQRAA